MATQDKNHGGWKDARSTYSSSTKEGKLMVKGVYCHCDLMFKFSANEQSAGDYIMRGQVVMLSPKDGKRMEIRGKLRRERLKALGAEVKQSDLECLKILKQFSLHEKTEEAIKIAIEKAAKHLYGKHIAAVETELQSIPGGQLQPVQLARLYGEKYLSTKGAVSAKTLRRNLSTIEKICAMLNSRHAVAEQINESDIDQIAKKLGKNVRGDLILAKNFWDYCLARGVIFGSNPFGLYLSKYSSKTKTDAAALQRRALSPSSLPVEVERALNRRIACSPPSDLKLTGILLIKETGLSATDVCAITWDAILFHQDDPLEVSIALQKDDAAGATHNYKIPVSRFCASELWRRLAAQGAAPNRRRRVLSIAGKTMDSKTLTAACRTELLHAGIGYASLQANRAEPFGVGVQLLLKNYRHRLENICGLHSDQGALRFLMTQSLAGYTTADHYRSFTSQEGQYFLRLIIDRDGRFEVILQNAVIQYKNNFDGSCTITAPPLEPDRLNVVSVQCLLLPGETITISARGGVQGSAYATKARISKRKFPEKENAPSQLSLFGPE